MCYGITDVGENAIGCVDNSCFPLGINSTSNIFLFTVQIPIVYHITMLIAVFALSYIGIVGF